MVTTDAEIVVGIRGDTRGGDRVKRSLDDIDRSGSRALRGQKGLEKQFKRTSTAGDTLKRTLGGLSVAFGLRQLQQTVDTYTNIQNRLKLVTDNTQELVGVTKELFNIANETRLSFESTAEIYARTALATKELGLSQRDTLQFTKSLNQAVVLSGASAAEANAGMIQLSQGLASGALRGDELRSVLEQLPAVADVIAKSLGITRGELRTMGEQGAITADVIIDAFKEARVELEENFAKTVPTIGQAFVVLTNNVTEFVGELDKTSGASAEVAKGLIFVSKHLDELTKLIVVATGAWVLFKAMALAATGAAVLAGMASFVAIGIELAGVMGVISLAGTSLLAVLTGPVGIAVALAAVGFAAFTFKDDLTAGVTTVLAEIIILADKAALGLSKLFGGGLSGNVGNISGLTPEEIRGGAAAVIDKLVRDQDEATKPKGRVSTEAGPRTTKSAISKATIDGQKALLKLVKSTSTEQETLLARIRELGRLREFATTAEEVQALDRALMVANEELLTASDTIPGMTDNVSDLAKSMDRFADSTAEAFVDFVSGTVTARDALSSLLKDLAKMTLEIGVTKPLSGLLGNALSAGLGGLFGAPSAASSFARTSARGASNPALFGPGFASGGGGTLGGNAGVDQNQLSLNGRPIARVGRGEDLRITPKGQNNSGAAVIVNQTINVSTGVVETVRNEMFALLPEFKRSTESAVNEAKLRGQT